MRIALLPGMMNEASPEQVAFYTGQDRAHREWLLDDRDVWVRNPHYTGAPTPHPYEYDDCETDADYAALDAHYAVLAIAHDARTEGHYAEALAIEASLRPKCSPACLPDRPAPDDLPF